MYARGIDDIVDENSFGLGSDLLCDNKGQWFTRLRWYRRTIKSSGNRDCLLASC